MITVDTFGFVVHHARASWAIEQPSSSAIGRSRSTLASVAASVSRSAQPLVAGERAARVVGDAVAVLAGQQPRRQRAPDRGRRSRCRRTAGRTRSRPACASSRLYCGCSVTGLCRWWRSAISIAARISSADHSLVPQYSALPADDDVAHRPHRLLDRRVGVGAVAVEDVDEVVPEALQRAVDGLHQVLAVQRVAHVRRRRARPQYSLVVSTYDHRGQPSSCERLAHDRLALAAGVGLGVVEEVAARRRAPPACTRAPGRRPSGCRT